MYFVFIIFFHGYNSGYDVFIIKYDVNVPTQNKLKNIVNDITKKSTEL